MTPCVEFKSRKEQFRPVSRDTGGELRLGRYGYGFGNGNGHGRRAFNFVSKFSKVVWCGCRSVVQEEARPRGQEGENFRGRVINLYLPPLLLPLLLGVNARGIYLADVCNFAPSDFTPRPPPLLIPLPSAPLRPATPIPRYSLPFLSLFSSLLPNYSNPSVI